MVLAKYLIIDHLAFSLHLEKIKKIVAAHKIQVIVPNAAIQMLDEMKTSSNGARNSIRWLERMFQTGNQWLRAQRLEETKDLTKEFPGTNSILCQGFTIFR